MGNLKNILENIPQDTFDADLFSEWFIDNQLIKERVSELSDEQIIEVGDNLSDRFGEKEKLNWFSFILEF